MRIINQKMQTDHVTRAMNVIGGPLTDSRFVTWRYRREPAYFSLSYCVELGVWSLHACAAACIAWEGPSISVGHCGGDRGTT